MAVFPNPLPYQCILVKTVYFYLLAWPLHRIGIRGNSRVKKITAGIFRKQLESVPTDKGKPIVRWGRKASGPE